MKKYAISFSLLLLLAGMVSAASFSGTITSVSQSSANEVINVSLMQESTNTIRYIQFWRSNTNCWKNIVSMATYAMAGEKKVTVVYSGTLGSWYQATELIVTNQYASH